MSQFSCEKGEGETKRRRKRSTYAKISLKNKIIFFQKVINERRNLRQMANKLGIKYSTAKTLVRNYRGINQLQDQQLVKELCKEFHTKNKAKKRCSYKDIDEKYYEPSAQDSQNVLNRVAPISKIEIVSSFLSTKQQ